MPVPRTPNRVAAVMTIRPSPEPRSSKTSFGPIPASSSMASTTFCGVVT
jgi:hypothetical protein